jgi:hypothetical protein
VTPDLIHLNSYREAALDWSAPAIVTAQAASPVRGKTGRANLVVIEATQKARSLDERLAERKPSRYEVHGELKLTGG